MMQKFWSLFFFGGFTLLAVTFEACQHEPFGSGEDPAVPTDPDACDPDVVYFESQVLPILQSSCAISGCHDAATAEDGVVLTSYEKVMQTGEIRAGNPRDSELYEKLVENDKDERMPPPPRERLPQEQIDLIAKWITQGAKDLTCNDDSGVCNTENVGFAATVQPIINTHCRGCHSGGSPSGNVNLSTYSGIAAVANSGRLYGAIAHQPGFIAMPQGGAKLSQCSIDQVKNWIDAGAPNN